MVRKLGSALLVIAGIAVALVIAEFAARLVFPPVRGVSWYHYDPRYAFRYRKNLDVTTNEWGDGAQWQFRTNSRGFVGADWASKPTPSVTRVIVAGDSFTSANGVGDRGAYPEVAQRDLLRSGAKVEIINLAVSAWGPQNALGYLDTEGADIQASCLVYGFFLGNDVIDNVRYGLYVLNGSQLSRAPVPPTPPRASRLLREGMREIPLYDFLVSHSELFNLLRKGVIGFALRRDAHNQQVESMSDVAYQRALDLNDATLSALADLARRRFGGFGLVLIPLKGELTSVVNSPFSAERAEQARVRVRLWAREHNVCVLDLTQRFPRDRSQIDAFYFSKDFHWSSAGQAAAGKLMADDLGCLCRNEANAPAIGYR